jgi:subtilisin family serine protease
MSLGTDRPTASLESAIDFAISQGVIIVASAGNRGPDGMGWPGDLLLPVHYNAAEIQASRPTQRAKGCCGGSKFLFWPELTRHLLNREPW